MKDVDDFLRRFHSSENIDDVFTNSCSYWFAAVLFGRFIRDGATIMYDKATNYFGTRIKGRVYDITGDVTNEHQWAPWESIDGSLREEIARNSIMF